MPEITCFLLAPSAYVRRTLRRFAYQSQRVCPSVNPFGCCDASVVIEGWLLKPREGRYETSPSPQEFAGHPAWPDVCAYCHGKCAAYHQWQVNDHRLWENVERGILTTIRWDECPVGAMWFSDWNDSHGSVQWRARGGGPHLNVMTPGGEWDVDAGCRDDPVGSGWERTGEPPGVTAQPSILIGTKYHGWLREGKLIDA